MPLTSDLSVQGYLRREQVLVLLGAANPWDRGRDGSGGTLMDRVRDLEF